MKSLPPWKWVWRDFFCISKELQYSPWSYYLKVYVQSRVPCFAYHCNNYYPFRTPLSRLIYSIFPCTQRGGSFPVCSWAGPPWVEPALHFPRGCPHHPHPQTHRQGQASAQFKSLQKAICTSHWASKDTISIAIHTRQGTRCHTTWQKAAGLDEISKHWGAVSWDGQPGRPDERPQCHHSARIWMLEKQLSSASWLLPAVPERWMNLLLWCHCTRCLLISD